MKARLTLLLDISRIRFRCRRDITPKPRKRYRLFEAHITPPRDRSDDEVRRLLGSERFFPKNDRAPGAAGARPSATPDVFSSDDSTQSNFSGFDADAFH